MLWKKRKKIRTYPKELKEEILNRYYNENLSQNTLAKIYGIPRASLKNWIQKVNHGEDPLISKRELHCGRPAKKDSSEIDYKERYEILKKYQAFLKAQRKKK